MRKVKRKYTRGSASSPQASSVPPTTRNPKRDAPEPISSPPKVESSSKTPAEFSFDDLPLSIRTAVESIIKYRKRLNLPDDSKDRRTLAIRMFRGDRPR